MGRLTSQVSVYSLADDWHGPPIEGVGSDLGASISSSYTLNGQPQSRTQNTPFNFEADIGSQMVLSVSSNPASWAFACNWDHYTYGQHLAQCTLSDTVNGDDQIAAFFKQNPPPPPPQPPPTPSCSPTLFSIGNGFSYALQQFASLCVYSLPISYLGENPLAHSYNDLHARIEADYVSNGQSRSIIESTPFGIAPDVGSHVTLRVISAPPGWAISCMWDYYTHSQYRTCGLSIQVGSSSGTQSIAVFFTAQSPPPPQPTELTRVSVWALDIGYLGQDPATLAGNDIHESIFMNHIWHGQLYQDAHITPFTIDADAGSRITFSVLSPSGFTCTWDHYGWRQHRDTCTLEIQVTQNDKIVAFFQHYTSPPPPMHTRHSGLRADGLLAKDQTIASALTESYDFARRSLRAGGNP
jgi:hypothetical protein